MYENGFSLCGLVYACYCKETAAALKWDSINDKPKSRQHILHFLWKFKQLWLPLISTKTANIHTLDYMYIEIFFSKIARINMCNCQAHYKQLVTVEFSPYAANLLEQVYKLFYKYTYICACMCIFDWTHFKLTHLNSTLWAYMQIVTV